MFQFDQFFSTIEYIKIMMFNGQMNKGDKDEFKYLL